MLNTRSHGVSLVVRTSNGTTIFFNELVQGKVSSLATSSENIPGPYIVDQMEQTLSLEVKTLEVSSLFSSLQSKAIICIFNGLFPQPKALFQWVFTSWIYNYDIYLCSNILFILKFDTQKDF